LHGDRVKDRDEMSLSLIGEEKIGTGGFCYREWSLGVVGWGGRNAATKREGVYLLKKR